MSAPQPLAQSTTPAAAAASKPASAAAPLRRWRVTRSLLLQVMLFASLSLAVAIVGYSQYQTQSVIARERAVVEDQMDSLARNLALMSERLMATDEADQLERLIANVASVPGIYSLLLTDAQGQPLVETINQSGHWSPRFNRSGVRVPAANGPASVREQLSAQAMAHDYLAGTGGVLVAWQRIEGPAARGWVKVSYRLDAFDALARSIRIDALQALGVLLALVLPLLAWLLAPPLRALGRATEFARTLDTTLGARLRVSHRATEVQQLGEALNQVSARLLRQHTDLVNQKFALDAHAIVSITDLQGRITYANALFCEISGYQIDELIGQTHQVVKSGEHTTAFYERLWATISVGQVWRGELKNRRKDGSFYWVSATIVPLLGEDGLPHHYIGIRTDISEQKTLQQNLEQARLQAEQASLAKAQFLANMSHEIRTPMNAVLGMLRLLRGADLDARQDDYAEKAETAAQTLLQLLNDVLDFSKIEAGKMSLDPHPFRLDKLLRNLSVITSSNLGSKPVELLFRIAPDVPRQLLGDALRLQQVLINLMGNAVKFTAQGEVVLSVRCLCELPPDAPPDTPCALEFSVQDSGIGIAPEHLAHIFDGFSQAETSTTRRFGGTGLGLSISQRLVALMGGQLQVQSQPGRGSRFYFSLQLPRAAQASAADAAKPPPAPLPPHLRVLVVDDNALAREVLAGMALTLGWQVDVAEGGPQAVALLRQRRARGEPDYDVVFMDWMMPDMDGWQTLQRMDASGGAPPVVVMVTALGRDQLHQRPEAEQARLHGFLVKPVTASMLLDAVAEALQARSQPGQRPSSVAPEAGPPPLQAMRLLVVEDNPVNQQVARELLRGQGAQVELADNGRLGVDAVLQAQAAGQPFDAVLMDLQMPVMDGFEATRALRAQFSPAQLPIIAMTANAMARDRQDCLAAGMNEHVGKPFKLDELVALLRSIVPQPAQAAGPTPSVPPIASPPAPQLATPAVPTPVPTAAGAEPAAPPAGQAGAAAGPAPVRPAPLVLANAPEPPLPPVDAVDSADALERLGGDPQLYAQVLGAFLADLHKQPAALAQAMAQSDWSAVARLLHTQKGLASTVGACHLAAWAKREEARVKGWIAQARAPEGAPEQLLQAFADVVQRSSTVMQAVAATCTANPQAPAPFAPDAAARSAQADGADSLKRLAQLLDAHDLDALALFDALAQQLPLREDAALVRALTDFDFEWAARRLRTHHGSA